MSMIEPLLLSSSLLFGKELLAHTVAKTTSNIYCGIEELNNDETYEFKKLLTNLDINAKLEIIHEFINEFINEDRNIIKYNNNSINKLLNFLCNNLKDIEDTIENIKKEITIHKKKWFYKFRYHNYNTMIDKLKNQIRILDDRFELLIKLLNNNN